MLSDYITFKDSLKTWTTYATTLSSLAHGRYYQSIVILFPTACAHLIDLQEATIQSILIILTAWKVWFFPWEIFEGLWYI